MSISDVESTPTPEYAETEEAPETRTRVGVFGGSFDPVHLGHVTVARNLLANEKVHEMMFVPAKWPPHKLSKDLSPDQYRRDMLQLVVEENSDLSLSVCDVELQRGAEEPSYTYETLETLSATFPDARIFFVMGTDSLRDLHSWHRATELVHDFDFVIYPRKDVSPPSYAELCKYFGPKQARNLLNAVVEDMPEIGVSSTEIRERRERDESVSDCVPESVKEYIGKHQLYIRTNSD